MLSVVCAADSRPTTSSASQHGLSFVKVRRISQSNLLKPDDLVPAPLLPIGILCADGNC